MKYIVDAYSLENDSKKITTQKQRKTEKVSGKGRKDLKKSERKSHMVIRGNLTVFHIAFLLHKLNLLVMTPDGNTVNY